MGEDPGRAVPVQHPGSINKHAGTHSLWLLLMVSMMIKHTKQHKRQGDERCITMLTLFLVLLLELNLQVAQERVASRSNRGVRWFAACYLKPALLKKMMLQNVLEFIGTLPPPPHPTVIHMLTILTVTALARG